MVGLSTKLKIRSVAVDVFAERGFQEATIALISEAAGVNIAAVNYHFGSKETLFQAALQHAFELAESKYPLQSEKAKTPQDQLRVFMSAIIRRTFDDTPAGCVDQIIGHELVRADGPHVHTIAELQKRAGQILRPILAKILLTDSPPVINQAHVNIAALCFFPKIAVPLRKKIFPEPPTESQLQCYIDGQVAFARAGLAALIPSQTSQS